MLRIRVVKTASGAQAVQAIYYYNRKRKIFKHIGSANSEAELSDLKKAALDLINNYNSSLPFLLMKIRNRTMSYFLTRVSLLAFISTFFTK